jgi:triosephosphate isomerase (TIM)
MPDASDRTLLIAGNWKMYKTTGEAAAFCDALRGELDELDEVDLALCPPFTSLAVVAEELGELGVGVWGQNVHEAEEGPFTGEISARMLVDAGATGVLLGHSERRQLFGETDEALQRKLAAVLAAGLEPVLCVGETEVEREGGQTETRLRTQVETALGGIDPSAALQLTIAYEPVWAIGTGKTATPQIAQEAHAFIRGLLIERLGDEAAAAIRILYGGSVKPDNARELLDQEDVDGALVGGASLDPSSFAAIARAGLPG